MIDQRDLLYNFENDYEQNFEFNLQDMTFLNDMADQLYQDITKIIDECAVVIKDCRTRKEALQKAL